MRLFLFVVLTTVYGSLPQIDGQSKPILRVSSQVNISSLFNANPLLKKLPIVAKVRGKTPSPTSPPIDRKIFSRSPGDNFHALYKRLNESLFSMAEPDKKVQIQPITSSEEENFEDEETPFAVTESLLTSLQPTLSETKWEQPTWSSNPPVTRTFSPLPEIDSKESSILKEIEELQKPQEIDLHGEVPFTKPRKLAPLQRASEWQVQHSGNGRYLVSGTQFYEDNRVNGGVMVEEYKSRGNEEEIRNIRQDKRYAVEAELTRMKTHAAMLRAVEKPLARGAKTVSLRSSMILDEDKIERFSEDDSPSKTEIIIKKGKKMERRLINRKGKEIEVELSNPLLWNHDLLSYPGAIIHGPLKKTKKLTSISKCFESLENTRLGGVIPIDRRISPSTKECLRFCARSPLCKTVVFEESLSMCEIFSEQSGEAVLQKSTSSVLFEPIVEDPEKCLSTTRRRVLAAPIVKKKEIIKNCSPGQEHILTRQEGVRIINSEWKEKFNTNEDDCVSACLSGSTKCIAATYSHESQECLIYNNIGTEIAVHQPTTLYSKICVTEQTALKCAGATIEHVKQAVLLSSMREAKHMKNREDCLEACVTTSSFKCLSIMFYPKERTSCILNDGSLTTTPDSFVEETIRDVEYFGVEECYGIQETTDHSSNFIVEDDIKKGEVTKGSRLEALH